MKPSLLDKNWLVHKILLNYLKNPTSQYIQGKLLDIGCGEKPYKEIFKKNTSQHIGLDHKNTKHNKNNIDIYGTAYRIPLSDKSIDTVLCTSVLEHLEDPQKAIKETYRILKTGGHAIYTAPLFWHIHEEPRDFYRYTNFGLQYLFKKNNFQIIQIIPLSGFIVTFGQEFVYILDALSNKKIIKYFKIFFIILKAFIQALCYHLNKFDNSKKFTWMYLAIVKK